jgi:SAM-dependent methyltransferase
MRWRKVDLETWEAGPGQERRRLQPRLYDPSYCELRALAKEMTGFVQERSLAGTTILDYGCGDRPYEPLFPSDCFYVGIDVIPNPAADVVSDRRWGLPLADEVVDLVIATQTMPHVEDYDLYLRECLRVLKPGGTLLVTTPGTYLSGPGHDFWRFTPTGLALILERNGFQVEAMKPLLGILGTALLLRGSVYNRVLRNKGLTPLAHVVASVMNLRIMYNDRFSSRVMWMAPAILSCVARKASSEETSPNDPPWRDRASS